MTITLGNLLYASTLSAYLQRLQAAQSLQTKKLFGALIYHAFS